jgi:hypothetical protein
LETASFSIPPAEELDKLSDEHIEVASKGIANALFHLKPPPDEVRNTLAAFFRYLAEKRSPAAAHRFVTEHMAPYTLTEGEHFSEDNEQYLTDLSMALHNHGDYQHAFTLIGEAVRKGEISRPAPAEPTTPAD